MSASLRLTLSHRLDTITLTRYFSAPPGTEIFGTGLGVVTKVSMHETGSCWKIGQEVSARSGIRCRVLHSRSISWTCHWGSSTQTKGVRLAKQSLTVPPPALVTTTSN